MLSVACLPQPQEEEGSQEEALYGCHAEVPGPSRSPAGRGPSLQPLSYVHYPLALFTGLWDAVAVRKASCAAHIFYSTIVPLQKREYYPSRAATALRRGHANSEGVAKVLMCYERYPCDTFGSAVLGSSWMQKRLGTGTPLLQRDGIKRTDAICGQL
jgi:hypothetical protein